MHLGLFHGGKPLPNGSAPLLQTGTKTMIDLRGFQQISNQTLSLGKYIIPNEEVEFNELNITFGHPTKKIGTPSETIIVLSRKDEYYVFGTECDFGKKQEKLAERMSQMGMKVQPNEVKDLVFVFWDDLLVLQDQNCEVWMRNIQK